MRREFTELKAASGAVHAVGDVKKARKKDPKVKRKGLATGLVRTPADVSRADITKASFDLSGRLPVYYASVRLGKGGWAGVEPVRSYKINTRVKGQSFPAYASRTTTARTASTGACRGLTWRNPPILKDQHTTITRNGRKLMAYRTGNRYRLVAWRTSTGVYWVSNTVSNLLTNAQMLDIAANLKRVPG